MDPVLRAYATLGLSRGCSQAVVKKQYRMLVKRWHPDRFASDPDGARQAGEELRAINHAFKVVAEDLSRRSRAVMAPIVDVASPVPADTVRPFSRSEIDAIIGALGSRSPVDDLLDWIVRSGPFALAALFLARPRGGRQISTVELALGIVCLGWGAGLWLWQRRS